MDAGDFDWIPGVPGAWIVGAPMVYLGSLLFLFSVLFSPGTAAPGGVGTAYFGEILAAAVGTSGLGVAGHLVDGTVPLNRRIGVSRVAVVLDRGMGGILVPWDNVRFESSTVVRWLNPARPSRWTEDGYHRFALTPAQAGKVRWRFELQDRAG
jgi:hypothetical protein